MNAGWTCAEREALSRTCRPLGTVLGIIEQVPCEVHEVKPGRFCDPRACLPRAEAAGFADLITGAEFGLIAGMQEPKPDILEVAGSPNSVMAPGS